MNPTMFYHAKIILGNGQEIFWQDGGLGWYKENVIIPIFNGQVVTIKYMGKTRILNMKSVSEVYLYRTDTALDGFLQAKLTPLNKDFEEFNLWAFFEVCKENNYGILGSW